MSKLVIIFELTLVLTINFKIMKRVIAFFMCLMIAFFFTITPAQSKSVVGSDMGIPTICNLQNNYISQNSEPTLQMQMLQNWGLLYRQIGVSNLCNITPKKQTTRYVGVNICHYDPGWQNQIHNS